MRVFPIKALNALLAATASLMLLAPSCAQADGLADLKAALSRLQGQTPVKAQLEVKVLRRSGEGKEQEEDQGQAVLQLEDNARGLQLLYTRELMARSESEERAKSRDPKARTPSRLALAEANTTELRHLINAGPHLARQIDELNFKGERADNYNGVPARLLSFEPTLDKLPEKERKYIKKFEGSMDLWIAADGTPLGSRARSSFSGRMFVVLSMDGRNESERSYSVVGDRLLASRQEDKSSSSGTIGSNESRISRQLQLLN